MAFDKPQSRNEAILQNMLGANNVLEPPQSREEYLLQEILNNGVGGGGGVSVKEITDTSVAGEVEPQEKVTVALSPALTSDEKVVGIAYLDILDAGGNPLSFVVTDSKILDNGTVLSVTIMNALLVTQVLHHVTAGIIVTSGSGGGGAVPTVSANTETHTVLISNNKSGEGAAEFSFGDVRSQEALPDYMEVETRMYDEESGEDIGRSYYFPTRNLMEYRVLPYVINLDDEQNRPTYRQVVLAIDSGREIRILSEAYGNMTLIRRYYDSDKVELSAASSERNYPSNLYLFTLIINSNNEYALQKEQLSPESITQLITSRTPEVQIAGDWKYKIGFDGTFEAWYKQTGYRIEITDTTGVLYRSPLTPLALPTELTDAYDCEVTHASVNCGHNNYVTWAELASTNATGINFYALSGGSRISNPNYTLTAYVFGTLTAKA